MSTTTDPKPKQNTPTPFDRKLVRQRRGRAQKAHRDAKQNQSDRFLYDRIVGDTAERILDVNRSFPHVLLLGDTDLTRALANLLGDKFGFCVFADHSHYSGADGSINSNLSTLTTALHIANKITVKIK